MCQNEPNPESQIKDFRGFSSFRELGNAANGIFHSSQYWESRFSPIFCFPNVGKAYFRRFLIFPRGGKPIFVDFWFSPREGKPIFVDFCPSYPYESFFLSFFAHRTPTKVFFCRFSFIVPLRKPSFPVFYQLYPVSEWFFAKIDDLHPYLSSFSYWAVSDCWFSKRHLCFDTASFLDCICIFLHWLQNVLYNMVLWEYILFITFASCK